MKDDDSIIPNGDDLFAQPAEVAGYDDDEMKTSGGRDAQQRRSVSKGTRGTDAQMRRTYD
jgi:hypothetical protein